MSKLSIVPCTEPEHKGKFRVLCNGEPLPNTPPMTKKAAEETVKGLKRVEHLLPEKDPGHPGYDGGALGERADGK